MTNIPPNVQKMNNLLRHKYERAKLRARAYEENGLEIPDKLKKKLKDGLYDRRYVEHTAEAWAQQRSPAYQVAEEVGRWHDKVQTLASLDLSNEAYDASTAEVNSIMKVRLDEDEASYQVYAANRRRIKMDNVNRYLAKRAVMKNAPPQPAEIKQMLQASIKDDPPMYISDSDSDDDADAMFIYRQNVPPPPIPSQKPNTRPPPKLKTSHKRNLFEYSSSELND
jgi:hypothetical protein